MTGPIKKILNSGSGRLNHHGQFGFGISDPDKEAGMERSLEIIDHSCTFEICLEPFHTVCCRNI